MKKDANGDQMVWIVRLDFRRNTDEGKSFGNCRFMDEWMGGRSWILDTETGERHRGVGISVYRSRKDAEIGYRNYRRSVSKILRSFRKERDALIRIGFDRNYPELWSRYLEANGCLAEDGGVECFLPRRVEYVQCAESVLHGECTSPCGRFVAVSGPRDESLLCLYGERSREDEK